MQAHDIHRPLNIFYIHEVEFENEEFRDMLLTDILINLPDIMFSHTNKSAYGKAESDGGRPNHRFGLR